MNTQEDLAGGQQNQNDQGSEGTGANNYQEKLERLEQNTSQLTEMMQSFLASQQKQEVQTGKPAITSEQFKAMMEKDPQQAISMVLDNVVESKVSKKAQAFEVSYDRKHWDNKAETDFPMIRQDESFRKEVKKEMDDLISQGMPKDSPKLVYKAAELAALKTGKKPAIQASSGYAAGMSGEAPTSGGKKITQLDAQQLQLQKLFGLKDVEKLKGRIQKFSDRRGR